MLLLMIVTFLHIFDCQNVDESQPEFTRTEFCHRWLQHSIRDHSAGI